MVVITSRSRTRVGGEWNQDSVARCRWTKSSDIQLVHHFSFPCTAATTIHSTYTLCKVKTSVCMIEKSASVAPFLPGTTNHGRSLKPITTMLVPHHVVVDISWYGPVCGQGKFNTCCSHDTNLSVVDYKKFFISSQDNSFIKCHSELTIKDVFWKQSMCFERTVRLNWTLYRNGIPPLCICMAIRVLVPNLSNGNHRTSIASEMSL